MRSRRWRYCRSLWELIVASCLLLVAHAAPGSAQDDITVTVYYVPANDACRPDGYRRAVPSDGAACETLRYDPDVIQWDKNRGVPRQSFSLNPDVREQLRLEDPLRGIINRYTNSVARLGDADHRAVVFLFDFGDPMVAEVSLTRTRTTQDTLWKGSLDGEQRWIVHQEVHWLHWFNQILWTLEVDGRMWSFDVQ